MKLAAGISNKSTIKLRFQILSFFILFQTILFFILSFIKVSITYKSEMQTGLVIFIAIFLVLFYRTRYFEFDASGEVIFMRSYHPVFKNYERRSEFPKEKLFNYEVKKNKGITSVRIYLKMFDNKKASVHYSIQGLNKNAIKALNISLQVTKDQYKNQPLSIIPNFA